MSATTMTERQMLELAAKAAGLRVRWEEVHFCFWIEPGQLLPVEPWSPLTDDGDALRLARAVHMTVAFEPSRGGWSSGAAVNGEFSWLAHDEDQLRAIVLAAAEIGKALP